VGKPDESFFALAGGRGDQVERRKRSFSSSDRLGDGARATLNPSPSPPTGGFSPAPPVGSELDVPGAKAQLPPAPVSLVRLEGGPLPGPSSGAGLNPRFVPLRFEPMVAFFISQTFMGCPMLTVVSRQPKGLRFKTSSRRSTRMADWVPPMVVEQSARGPERSFSNILLPRLPQGEGGLVFSSGSPEFDDPGPPETLESPPPPRSFHLESEDSRNKGTFSLLQSKTPRGGGPSP